MTRKRKVWSLLGLCCDFNISQLEIESKIGEKLSLYLVYVVTISHLLKK